MKFTYRGSQYNYNPPEEVLQQERQKAKFTYRGITYNYSPLQDIHNVTALTVHIVFVTEHRHPVITQEIEQRLRELISRICLKRNCSLLSCQVDLGKRDHIHLLIDKNPNVAESDLATTLKNMTNREIKREFGRYLKSYYQKPVLWQRGYCAVSAGSASLKKLIDYVESQA